MSVPTLRLNTAPGSGLGLILAKECNGPAVQDDCALDPSTTVPLQ